MDNIEQAAFEQAVAQMSDDEFAAMVARTRAPSVPKPANTTHAQRVRAAEESGDWQASFRLKANQLGRLMNKNKD